jgi:hypothetical protein
MATMFNPCKCPLGYERKLLKTFLLPFTTLYLYFGQEKAKVTKSALKLDSLKTYKNCS